MGAYVIAAVVAVGVLVSGGTIWEAATGGVVVGVVVHALAWSVDYHRTRRRQRAAARSRRAELDTPVVRGT
jgi:membrane associated rhomboid family serine protease